MEIGKKEKSTEAWKEYKKSKQNAKRVISLAKEKKQKECASDLNDSNHQNGTQSTSYCENDAGIALLFSAHNTTKYVVI